MPVHLLPTSTPDRRLNAAFCLLLLFWLGPPDVSARQLRPDTSRTDHVAITDSLRPASAAITISETDLLRAVRHPSYRITSLLQMVGRAATDKDPIHSRNAFALDHVRFGFRTTLASPLNAVFQFNVSKDPNLLDAFFTYRKGNVLLKTGSFKPSQNLDLFVSPAQADFTGRGINSEQLIATRDIGIELMLGQGALQLHTGVFNGDRTSATPDNRFVWTGRLHLRPDTGTDAKLMAGVFSQAGLSDQTKMGIEQSIVARGRRSLLGADARWESRRWILAGEVMQAWIQTDPSRRSETYSGAFVTTGLKTKSGDQWLARGQVFDREGGPTGPDLRNMTLAWKRPLSELWMIRVDGTFHLDDAGAFEEAGLAVNLQMVF